MRRHSPVRQMPLDPEPFLCTALFVLPAGFHVTRPRAAPPASILPAIVSTRVLARSGDDAARERRGAAGVPVFPRKDMGLMTTQPKPSPTSMDPFPATGDVVAALIRNRPWPLHRPPAAAR